MAVINGDDFSNSIQGTNADDVIFANGGHDTIQGLDGNDEIDGGRGDDQMFGGLGDDIFIVNSYFDKVYEKINEGNDTIIADSSFSMRGISNVENLTLRGNATFAVGNELNNVIKGNAVDNELFGFAGDDTLYGLSGDDVLLGEGGDDILDGGAGIDQMSGGVGNDTYFVDGILDSVMELINSGTDVVNASVSYTLGADLENLTLLGTGNIDATGNELNNILTGNAGNNVLDSKAGNDILNGGLGSDRMSGGIGDDTYFVDSDSDQIIELVNNGTDIVNASVSYVLGENLEDLTLTGTANLDATGNELNNILTGNAGNNVLDGKGGADQLLGGLGDDTYMISDASDTIVEAVNAGTDTVNAAISYMLGDNLENLTLTGAANLIGTGNALKNTLKGNAGNNILNGKEGDDTLIGGLGNDIYIVNDVGDRVVENANEGVDVIAASVSYALSDNVEHLGLTGTANLNATGNALDNVLLGNAGVNNLDGGAGKDSLIGGGGQDTLKGGTEADQFIFTSVNDRVDRILDFSRPEGDKVVLVADGFKGLRAGSVKRRQFVLGNKAKDANDRLIYNKKTGALFYDADGSRGIAKVKIAVFDNKPILGASDFSVVASTVPANLLPAIF